LPFNRLYKGMVVTVAGIGASGYFLGSDYAALQQWEVPKLLPS
jgi:hypothetical protein